MIIDGSQAGKGTNKTILEDCDFFGSCFEYCNVKIEDD